MADDQALLSAVALGLDAEQFLNSPLGRYLLDRVEAEVDSAYLALKDADPEDSKGIRKLQNRVYRAQAAVSWLLECVQEGRNAERMATGDD